MTDFRLATASLKSAKVRTFLTMVAVIIGVAAYILVTSFIDGLKTSVNNQIQEFGGNLITVNPGDLTTRDEEGNATGFDPFASFGAISTLSEEDLKAISEIEGVEAAVPQMMISLKGSVKRNDTTFDKIIMIATNEDYPVVLNQAVAIGKFFSDDDKDTKVAVIGSSLATEMFPGGTGIGSLIEIRKEKFRVIGVLEDFPAAGLTFGQDFNRIVLLPLSQGKALAGGVTNIAEIDIKAAQDSNPAEVAKAIDDLLLSRHGGERDFTVLTEEEIVKLTGTVLDQVKSASQVLAYVMLFVGGIVIALIMLITVKERTREIGIRKSIGATNRNILTQFLIEAVVISWFGSLLGLLLAYLIGLYVAGTTDLSPSYTLSTVISVVIISTSIGAISGLIPAGMAAKKDPVQALRDE